MVRCLLFALSMLLVALPAGAESLYRCHGADGAVSIQSEPCPKGSTQVWKRDAVPDSSPSAEELAARAALAQAEADRIAEAARLAEQTRLAEQARREELAALRDAVGDIQARPERKSECTLAHEFSDTAGKLAWLELTQTQREKIKRWVVVTCRDPNSPVVESADL